MIEVKLYLVLSSFMYSSKTKVLLLPNLCFLYSGQLQYWKNYFVRISLDNVKYLLV